MVPQADAPSTSSPPHQPPHHVARNSLTTAAAIRRGEIKISNPIPIPDADDGGVPVPMSGLGPPPGPQMPGPPSSAGGGRQDPMTLTDIRPPQPPQFNGLYDGRPPTRTRGRGMVNANGTVLHSVPQGETPLQHTRAGRSVEVLPTQPPVVPVNPQKRTSLAIRRNSPPDNKRHSKVMSANSLGASYDTSVEDDVKEISKEKKRGSGSLRAVLRKVFGGGSKKEKDHNAPSRKASKSREIGDWMINDHENDAVTRSNTTHNMNRLATGRNGVIDPMKLPIHEITPKTPLGSHLPFPMNVNAPQPSPPRISAQNEFAPHPFDPPGSPMHVPRRRATLPSLVLSPSDVAALSEMWDKEVEAGAVGQDVKKRKTPTPDIGMAITKGSVYADRRRSRSADALTDLAKEQERMQQQAGVTEPTNKRASGRAAEIEYWRASYAPLPQEDDGIQTQDFVPSKDEGIKRQDTDQTSESGRSMKTAQLAQSEDEHGHHDLDDDEDDDDDSLIQRRTPPNERASFEKPSPEDVRIPHPFDRPAMLNPSPSITHTHSRNFSRPVADVQEVERIKEGLEDRLSKLEVMVQKLESSSNRRTIILADAPKAKWDTGDSSSESNRSRTRRQQDTNPFQVGPDFAHQNQENSPSTADASSPQTPTIPPPSRQARPSLSASSLPTKTPASYPYQHHAPPQVTGSFEYATPSSSANPVASSLPSPNIYDHLAPLYAALRYERSKRKEFASQMQDVKQQLHEMNTVIRSHSSYDSSSSSHLKVNGGPGARGYRDVQARGGGRPSAYPTPSPDDGFGSGSLGFGTDDDGLVKYQQSRFSGLEYDSSEDDDDTRGRRNNRRYRNAEDADADSGAEREVYGTPKEESMLSPELSQESQSVPVPSPPSHELQTPTQPKMLSKIPTPKQSMTNMRKQPSYGSMGGTGSSSTVGTSGGSARSRSGSARNRFGFLGGKAR